MSEAYLLSDTRYWLFDGHNTRVVEYVADGGAVRYRWKHVFFASLLITIQTFKFNIKIRRVFFSNLKQNLPRIESISV